MATPRSSCSSRPARRLGAFLALAGALALPRPAAAQDQPPAPTGAPPKEAEALVAAPKDSASAPKIENKIDGTTASVSAGSLLTTGNSRLFAASGNGVFETRFDNNGIGASILGNYGQGAAPGEAIHVSTANLQGRLRYDRYIVDQLAAFLINTGRYDRFQGLDFRYNLDPGIKYLFIPEIERALWAELGYDFQYDARNGNALTQVDASGNPIPGAPPLPQTATDHSVRAYLGFKHAFNSQVTLTSGLEYLQSLYSSDNVLPGANYDYRINFDALLAANLGAGFSFGLGFTARYDNAPLPGKQNTDTVTTFNLIYAFSDIVTPPTCPCPAPPPPPAPAPESAPVPGAAPVPASGPASAPAPATAPPPANPSAPPPTTPPPAAPPPASPPPTTP